MKILFVMRHAGYVRNFESTLRMLCDRGHTVHLAFEGPVKYAQLDPDDIARQLGERYPGFTYGDVVPRVDGWGLLGRELRLALDFLRYLEPVYAEAPKLRERARRGAPPFMLERTQGVRGTAAGRRAMAVWLRAMNRAIPSDPRIDSFIRAINPDIVAVTPLIEPGSPQAEYLRSARALGVRTAYCVASWDNLTNKGLIHGPVDLVAVWNDAMKREAVAMHGVPADRVVVTGAAAFDHWFGWQPSTTREAFCARVGLPADRPYLLYLCSSKFVAPEEVPFVRAWLERMRRWSGPLREAGILVRPHPQHAEQWQGVDFTGLGPVAVWPAAGTAPVDAHTRSDYFDSMYHSAASVGINTTAEIESAILGRPVFTLLAPEFRDTQEGTLHFRHLREVNGGLLRVAPDVEQHLTQLETAIREPQEEDLQCRRFVEAFVRPLGIDAPATPRLVDALEQLARQPAAPPARDPMWVEFVRRRIAPRAAELEKEAATNPESYAARLAFKEAKEARRHAREAERRARLLEKVRQAEERRGKPKKESVSRQQRLEGMILDFHKMGAVDRRNFLRAIVDGIPLDSFIELHAANKPRKLDYERADIYMRVTSKTETFRVKACAKEPFTIDWIHQRIRPGDVVYDIGANVGAYALVAASQPGGGAQVFCFEASYANVAALCANIAINGLAPRITPVPIALSDTTAMNVFNLRDPEPGGARHSLGDTPPADGPALYSQPVMMFRLDDAVDLFRLPPPDHVKLDVDGGEVAVLEGALRTLASPTLKSLLVEVSASLSDSVTEVLGRCGLRLESKVIKQNKAGEYAVWYGVFGRAAHDDAAVAVAYHVETSR